MKHISPVTSDRWSLQTWFSALLAPDYLAFKASLVRDLADLKTRVDSLLPTEPSALAGAVAEFEKACERFWHFSSYLGCLAADDAENEPVKAERAWSATLEAELAKVRSSLQGTLATLDDSALAQLQAEPAVAGIQYSVLRMRHAGRHQMAQSQEELAADLNVDGLHAWSRLYDTLTSRLSFEMTFPDGRVETVPMSRRRALMAEPDRRLREAAFHAGQKPWLDHEDTLAAALNGMAGARHTLYGRRGLGHFLEAPLFDAAMSRQSLDAMLEAIRIHIEIPRRMLRVAARLQGTTALHYFDLEAPQVKAPDERALSWDEACSTVEHAFRAAYPKLGTYFREMLEHRWIEAQPRTGKRPGAFCSVSHLRGEERIYMTWHNTVHDMVTLAHEAGHAFHSSLLRPARALAAEYPMTLAETASNFGEMILLEGLTSDPALSPAMRAYLLDQSMVRAHSYLLNIPMRYEFERSFYEERKRGEVAVSRFKELMSAAQRQIYGDTLLPGGEDPLFWASKMHFFISDLSFYNFPYVFGYLLSQALFARFKSEGAAFLPRYEAFLAATGQATCEDVARQSLGVDLTAPEFWAAGIHSLQSQVAAYEALPR